MLEAAQGQEAALARKDADVKRQLALLQSRALRDRLSALTCRLAAAGEVDSEEWEGGREGWGEAEVAVNGGGMGEVGTPASTRRRGGSGSGRKGSIEDRGATPISRLAGVAAGGLSLAPAPAEDAEGTWAAATPAAAALPSPFVGLPAWQLAAPGTGGSTVAAAPPLPAHASPGSPIPGPSPFQQQRQQVVFSLGGSGMAGSERTRLDVAERLAALVTSVEARLGGLNVAALTPPAATAAGTPERSALAAVADDVDGGHNAAADAVGLRPGSTAEEAAASSTTGLGLGTAGPACAEQPTGAKVAPAVRAVHVQVTAGTRLLDSNTISLVVNAEAAEAAAATPQDHQQQQHSPPVPAVGASVRPPLPPPATLRFVGAEAAAAMAATATVCAAATQTPGWDPLAALFSAATSTGGGRRGTPLAARLLWWLPYLFPQVGTGGVLRSVLPSVGACISAVWCAGSMQAAASHVPARGSPVDPVGYSCGARWAAQEPTPCCPPCHPSTPSTPTLSKLLLRPLPCPLRIQPLRLLCAYTSALALSPVARLALNRWTALLSALGSSLLALALWLAVLPLQVRVRRTQRR